VFRLPREQDAALVVPVRLGPRSYEVRVVSGCVEEFGAFARSALDAQWSGRGCRGALLVTDEHVAPLAAPYAAALERAGIATATAVLPPGEATKSLDQAVGLYERLIEWKADRHTALVALGGGVIGDLAGFVAATYARGLPLLMVPTSLLAQVDSSVGGKVGVNHPRAKNIIGAFHQPVGVWIDTETLRSLPAREVRCGLAEVVKYGVILDADFFTFLEQSIAAIQAMEPLAIRHIVAQCCRLKAGVVEQDEREETGLRAVLNFGHTIGHAIEAVAGYGGTFQHGEAVAVGMVAECRLAERLGRVEPATTGRLAALLRAFGLPIVAPGLDPNALLDAMTRDKKNQSGRIRFVLPQAIGRVELTDAPSEAQVRDVLAQMISAV
jgi:3-dehydroquinate synthase